MSFSLPRRLAAELAGALLATAVLAWLLVPTAVAEED